MMSGSLGDLCFRSRQNQKFVIMLERRVVKSYKLYRWLVIKESINLGFDCFAFCPSSCFFDTIVAVLLILLHSRRSSGLARGTRNFSPEMHQFNLIMLTYNPSVNQLQLSTSLIISVGMFGMFVSPLIKCLSLAKRWEHILILLPRFTESTVGQNDPSDHAMAKRCGCNTYFSLWDKVSTVARNILRVQVTLFWILSRGGRFRETIRNSE